MAETTPAHEFLPSSVQERAGSIVPATSPSVIRPPPVPGAE
jgi:hypothetical protein